VLSANANTTLSAKPVSFFSSLDLLTPANTAGQLCKAWVNFNGTGTVAIRASYNVSSITDNGVGDYTVNFTTAMVDANYASVSACDAISSFTTPTVTRPVTLLAGSFRFRCVDTYAAGPTPYDSSILTVAIFR
jgi:hypothetical protein